jgi:hypothetical protein
MKTIDKFYTGVIVGIILGVLIAVFSVHHFFHYFAHHFFENYPKFYCASDDYQCMACETACSHKIDSSLLFAIVQQESAWNPKAVSHRGAIGLMQIMPQTALDFCDLTEKQLYNPRLNLDCGTAYFARQLKNFGSVKLALCAYNAGPTRVRKLGRCPKFKETTQYTRIILKKWKGDK